MVFNLLKWQVNGRTRQQNKNPPKPEKNEKHDVNAWSGIRTHASEDT